MSLWTHLFDTDRKQRNDIESAQEAISAVSEFADDARDLVRRQEQRIDRLELLVETLYTCLEQAGTVDRARFAALVEQTDLADGNLDGRVGPDVSARAPKCGACGKPTARKRAACLYCGAAVSRARRR